MIKYFYLFVELKEGNILLFNLNLTWMDILSLDEFSKLSFNIYLPKRSTQCRMELSKRIQDLGGVFYI
jgi:hypothetical protein